MKILANTSIDFMSLRRVLFPASLVLAAAGLLVTAVVGLNMGIDFTGGTELQLKFAERPDLARIRSDLTAAGLDNPTVTTIGAAEAREVYIRVAGKADGEGSDESARVLAALRGPTGRPDLNIVDSQTIAGMLTGAPGLEAGQEGIVAEAITAARRGGGGLFESFEEIGSIPGVSAEIAAHLESQAMLGPVAIRAQNYVGPSVAPELRTKAYWAVAASILAMLVYIGFRFRFQWGLGAIAALIHDVLVTMGVYALSGKEFSLPVVASFLTLVGYSVNDTIVVYDRIRENLRLKGAGNMERVINLSINQNLSRTVITSFLTWIVCVSLWWFGGEALNGFAFVLVVGVIVGTYSSIYIASPIILLWETTFGKRRKAGAPAASAKGRKADSTPSRRAAQR